MCDKVNLELPLFCPKPECSFYQKTDNKITTDGVYKIKSDSRPRQRYKCHGGNHRFSETMYSDLYKKPGSFKEYEMAAKMTSYGLSIEQIADILGRDVRTIEQWLKDIGKKSSLFHIFICSLFKLDLKFIQLDELWSFCHSKTHQLWVFIALEALSLFWINFELGSRTTHTNDRLVSQLKRLLNWTLNPSFKSDYLKRAAYKNALSKHFFVMKYHYLQIVKQRYKRRLVTVKKVFVKGSEKNFSTGTQNTSFIERFNLTLRQHVS